MPPKNEICRYFQSGSCRYGPRCKFFHPTSQQTQTNPFGVGAQTGTSIQRTNQQQQMPNPFGFGVQTNAHSRGGDGFGSKPNKQFENKWSRFSPINNSSASASRPSDNQSQAVNHKCTDPESCKRMIQEDLENEKPNWKLTCYGHSRNGPCDIVGDISYDELRALAYDDYKHGKSLQSIVERERNMLNSKLIEFQNLVQKPYTVSSAPTPSSQSLFAGGSTNTPIINNGFSPQVSSFSQLSGSLNTRSAAAVPNYSFGQQSSAFQNNNHPSSLFQMNNSPINGPGTFSNQPQQSTQSPFSFGTTTSNNGAISSQQNPFSTFAISSQTGNVADKQLNFFANEPIPASSAIEQSTTSIQLSDTIPKQNVDGRVWEKAEWKWNVGEIPEEAPPDIYIR
ncbi:hypothetical protein C2S51_028191 [Perilla frutescens var. frutescens]|nr:hypothetical protein C2S51_028191 [Perilla frutescens var. frutescens]